MLKRFLIVLVITLSLIFTLVSCNKDDGEGKDKDLSNIGSSEKTDDDKNVTDGNLNDSVENSNENDDNSSEPDDTVKDDLTDDSLTSKFVYSVNSNRFHIQSCRYALSMNSSSKVVFDGTIEELEGMGYFPCKICKPDPNFNYDQIEDDNIDDEDNSEEETDIGYVLNNDSMKFHFSTCGSVSNMKDENKIYSTDTRDELILEGYSPCGNCNP